MISLLHPGADFKISKYHIPNFPWLIPNDYQMFPTLIPSTDKRPFCKSTKYLFLHAFYQPIF
jgi:hypothetical protein